MYGDILRSLFCTKASKSDGCYILSTSQFKPATSQVLKSPMWLIDVILNSVERIKTEGTLPNSSYKAITFLTLTQLSNSVRSHNRPILILWLRMRTLEPDSLILANLHQSLHISGLSRSRHSINVTYHYVIIMV